MFNNKSNNFIILAFLLYDKGKFENRRFSFDNLAEPGHTEFRSALSDIYPLFDTGPARLGGIHNAGISSFFV